jgi:hypothetical protein
MNLDELINKYPEEEFLYPTGFEKAVVGAQVDENGIEPTRVILSIRETLSTLMLEHDMPYTEALEYFEYNIIGAYVGVHTPLWQDDEFEMDNSIIDYFNDKNDE